jgi:hypothetical protein
LIASEHSCKVLHQQNPLTIPCGRRPREWNRSRYLLFHLDHHRELGQKQRRKSTRFCWTLSKRFLAASLRKWTWRRKGTYTTSRDPLPTRTTNQPSQISCSYRSHQQPNSKDIFRLRLQQWQNS